MAYGHSSCFAISTCFEWMLALILCVLLLRRVDAQNRSDEVRALLDYKDSKQLGSLEFEGYWSTWNKNAANPCAWTGVVCSLNFTVVELDLSGWGSGPYFLLPLSGLRFLRHLDLSSSFLFEQQIPEDIGTLTGLVKLDLSQNDMTSTIPAGISNCTSLQYISLDQNFLSGEIPSLRALVNLEILNLSNNQLSGQFPKDLLELTSLVSIDLSRNMLNGSIPSLAKLTNLVDLRLDDNNFTDFEESWLPPPGLKNLLVSGNLLDGMIPPSIANLLPLETLSMSRNQLSSVPFSISQLFVNDFSNTSLRSLDLSQNQLSGNILESLLPESGQESMATVNLSQNTLTGSIPLDGDKVQRYAALDLSYNQLSGPIPFFFNNNGSQISQLLLQNNNLSGDLVDIFFSPTNIVQLPIELRLGNNIFTGDMSRIMACVNYNSQLQILDISNNHLEMTPTKSNPNPVQTTLVCFMQSRYLSQLWMAGNNFSGATLPIYVTNQTFQVTVLEEFAILDLSNNHIKGEILDTAFNSTEFLALQFLNLSNNDLIGLVPESIIKLPSLEILDVTNNGLSGPLPTIPRSSSLYNPSFFAGNGGLCGDPLPPCKGATIEWWHLIIVGVSMMIALGSCLIATWRWRVYHKRHQQDADLIRTLMDKESATLMSLRELKKATDNFAHTAQIGEGGFGTVYTGKLNDGTRVAIKRSKREGSETDKVQFLNEVKILSQVNHRHLVKLLGCCMESKIALLVFEFVSNGTLQEHLQGKFGDVYLTWKQRMNILVQTADALNYLHLGATFPIYHRDVKSANILLSDNLNAKVADFGISKLASVEATHVTTNAVQGTMGYIDPEYYTSFQLTDKSDVYSFGVVILEIISAKPALDLQRRGDETSLVNLAKPFIESGDIQQFIDPTLEVTYNDPTGRGSIINVGKLAMRCVDMRAKARPSMHDVLVELKTLSFQFDGVDGDLGSISKDSVQDSYQDGASGIQMSEFSLTDSEIWLNQGSNSKSSIFSQSDSI